MYIYLVKRGDRIDFGQYDSYVVYAKNKKAALLLLSGEMPLDNVTIKLLGKNDLIKKESLILGSFNAGCYDH